MSIIFPLFGTGTPQGTTDGYFLEGTDLKRIKSESFEIDTLFSNIDGFFVDRKENLYTSGGGNVKKYIKNFSTGSLIFAWQVSGGFSGGATVKINNNSSNNNLNLIMPYPFASGFANVAIDSKFNFYFRDTTDSNKLKKYSLNGNLVTSTNSDIGAFAVNKDNIISSSGGTFAKRDLSGNIIFTKNIGQLVPVAVNSGQVFTFNTDGAISNDSGNDTITLGSIRSYNLSDGNFAWSVNRIFIQSTNSFSDTRVFGFYDFIPLKNGNLLVRSYGKSDYNIGTFEVYNPFYGYILISPSGDVLHATPRLKAPDTINTGGTFNDLRPFFGIVSRELSTSLNQYLYTQGSNSDRSRLNF